MTTRAPRAALAALAAALCALPVGCGKKQAAKPGASQSVAPTSKPAPADAPETAPKGIPASIAAISRDTPEKAAASLRKLAETTLDPNAFAAHIDPSQAALASKFVGPAMIYFARHADLRRAAEERFGPSGAEEAMRPAVFFQVDLGNGLRESFDAARFEEVRRAGPTAYVMGNGKDGQPVGAAICFRENQGDWLLLLADGDKPWNETKLSNLAALVGGPMSGASPISKALGDLAQRTRAGEFKTSADLAAAIEKLNRG